MSSLFSTSMLSTTQQSAPASTWNGALSHGTSGEALTDLFYSTVRGLETDRLRLLLDRAMLSDRLLTLKMIAYVRRVRGGKGERDIGRKSLEWLAERSPRDLVHNLQHYVATFGRWDDLVYLIGNPSVKLEVLDLVAKQLKRDEQELEAGGLSISLAAKWVPSEGKKVDKVNSFNGILASHMGLTRRQMRQLLTRLRKAIDILETHLMTKTLHEVDYSKVPSVAMNRHGKPLKAFPRNDPARFSEYKASLAKGETKVNTDCLFPHQVIESYKHLASADELLEAQWKSILGRLTKEERGYLSSTLTVIDTSGSMSSTFQHSSTKPIHVALALGLLVTEINPNPAFKDLIVTFSSTPMFHRVQGQSLYSRINSLQSADWGMSTDFEATFRLILSKAKEFNLSGDDMPKTLLVISDMQFNSAGSLTNYESLQVAYKEAGYQIPKLVFWNVSGSTTDFPVKASEADTAMISGFSIEILKDVLSGEEITPFRVMMRTLNREEYKVISLAPTP